MGTVKKKTVKRGRSPASTHGTDTSSRAKKQKKTNATKTVKEARGQKLNDEEREASIRPSMPENNNGRVQGRQLIRWNPHVDQLLLLCIQYECQRAGIVLPWDAIAFRLSAEKFSTGPCITQHIQKLRTQMFERGAWVPPILGRKSVKKASDIRGVVKVHPNRQETRYVFWHEDASMLISPTDIDKIMRSGDNKGPGPFIKNELDDEESATLSSVSRVKRAGAARNLGSHIKKEASSDDGDMDLAELPSDEDFDPALSTKGKARRKAADKSKKKSKVKKENSDSEIASEDETKSTNEKVDICSSGTEIGDKKSIQPAVPTLSFNNGDGVHDRSVVLNLKPGGLHDFSSGVSVEGDDMNELEDLQADADDEGGSDADYELDDSKSEMGVNVEEPQFDDVMQDTDAMDANVQYADTANLNSDLSPVFSDTGSDNQTLGMQASTNNSIGCERYESTSIGTDIFSNPATPSFGCSDVSYGNNESLDSGGYFGGFHVDDNEHTNNFAANNVLYPGCGGMY